MVRGAIVNESGGFGVTGYSRQNFLGFNTGVNYADSNPASGPETITFDVSKMEINDTLYLSSLQPPKGVALLDTIGVPGRPGLACKLGLRPFVLHRSGAI